jgi:DNA-binding NarL/FixJ family response regulator
MGDSPLYRRTVEPNVVSGDPSRVRVAVANDYVVVVAGLSALLQPFADQVEVVDWLLFSGGEHPQGLRDWSDPDLGPVPLDHLLPPAARPGAVAASIRPVDGRPDLDAHGGGATERGGAPAPWSESETESESDGGPPTAVDVVLFDTFGRSGLGLDALVELLAHPRARRTALYTGDRDRARIDRALELGAAGVLGKSLSGAALARALTCIASGQTVVQLGDEPGRPGHAASNWPGRAWGLSERESEVLALITRGLRNQEIAEALFLSVDTVKSHVKAVYRKLGVRNRAAAVSAAFGDDTFAVARHDGVAR